MAEAKRMNVAREAKAEQGQLAVVEDGPRGSSVFLARVSKVGKAGRILRFYRLGDSLEYQRLPGTAHLVPVGYLDEQALERDTEVRTAPQGSLEGGRFASVDQARSYLSGFKRQEARHG